jgi:hypothetical protein
MAQRPTEVSIRLRFTRATRGEKRRMVLPIEASETTLYMVPNSVAARSVVTPEMHDRLRRLEFADEPIVRLPGRSKHAVIGPLTVVSQPLGVFEFEIRDVAQFRPAGGRNAVSGYLGLDFFLAFSDAMRFEFRSRMLTLELRKTEDR